MLSVHVEMLDFKNNVEPRKGFNICSLKISCLWGQNGLRETNCRQEGYCNNLYFLFVFYKFIYLYLAVLGLRCCARAFSSCGERGLLLVVVCGLLIAVASLVVEHGLQERRLQ